MKPESTNNQNTASYSSVNPLFTFAGMFSLSAGLQIPITALINLGAKKVAEGTPYPQGFQQVLTTPFGSIANQGVKTLKRRTVGSMLPAVFSGSATQYLGLSPVQTVLMNTCFETTVAGVLFREASEKLHAVNSKRFPLLDSRGIGADLTKIKTEESFFKYCRNSDATKHLATSEEWKVFNGRMQNYQANFVQQGVTQTARNGIFSAAAFLSGPIAKEFVEKNKEQFAAAGLTQKQAETTTTYALRAALALLTTPFDRLFTYFSSGEYTAQEVGEILKQDLQSGSVRKLFSGGVARTGLCLLTASTLAEGRVLGEAFKELCSKDAFCNSFTKHISDSFDRLSSIGGLDLSADPEVAAVKDSIQFDAETAQEGLKQAGFDIGKVSLPEVNQSVENAHQSQQAIAADMQRVLAQKKVREVLSAAEHKIENAEHDGTLEQKLHGIIVEVDRVVEAAFLEARQVDGTNVALEEVSEEQLRAMDGIPSIAPQPTSAGSSLQAEREGAKRG